MVTTTARVITRSRRFVDLYTKDKQILRAKVEERGEDVCVGDLVKYREEADYNFVTELLERKNAFERSYNKKTKTIATNLDLLLVVTAIGPLFNTKFMDKVLATGATEDIPCKLIVNKIDLDDEESKKQVAIYENIGIEVLQISAKEQIGIDLVHKVLSNKDLEVISLAGMSGVGKSTLLNILVPGADQRTSEVSEKTGHGKQTTTQALGHIYNREDKSEIMIIDLPGIQNFGISNFTERQAEQGFIEFREYSVDCEFNDCMHLAEPKCGVKDAISKSLISQSRYDSYLSMIEEIQHHQEF